MVDFNPFTEYFSPESTLTSGRPPLQKCAPIGGSVFSDKDAYPKQNILINNSHSTSASIWENSPCCLRKRARVQTPDIFDTAVGQELDRQNPLRLLANDTVPHDKKEAQKLRNRVSAQQHRDRQKKFLSDLRAELDLALCIRRELEWKIRQLEHEKSLYHLQNQELQNRVSLLTLELDTLRSNSSGSAMFAGTLPSQNLDTPPTAHQIFKESDPLLSASGVRENSSHCTNLFRLVGHPSVAIGIPTAEEEPLANANVPVTSASNSSYVDKVSSATSTMLITDNDKSCRYSPPSPSASDDSISTSASTSSFSVVKDHCDPFSLCLSKPCPLQPELALFPEFPTVTQSIAEIDPNSIHLPGETPSSCVSLISQSLQPAAGHVACLSSDDTGCTKPGLFSPCISSQHNNSITEASYASARNGCPNDEGFSKTLLQTSTLSRSRERRTAALGGLPLSPRLNLFFLTLSVVSVFLLPHFDPAFPYSSSSTPMDRPLQSSALHTYLASPVDVVQAFEEPQELVVYRTERSVVPIDYFQSHYGPLATWSLSHHLVNKLPQSDVMNAKTRILSEPAFDDKVQQFEVTNFPLTSSPYSSSHKTERVTKPATAFHQPSDPDQPKVSAAAYFKLLCPHPTFLVGSASELDAFLGTRSLSASTARQPDKDKAKHVVLPQVHDKLHQSYTSGQFVITVPTSALLQARFPGLARYPSEPSDVSGFPSSQPLFRDAQSMWELLQTGNALTPLLSFAEGLRRATESKSTAKQIRENQQPFSEFKENHTRMSRTARPPRSSKDSTKDTDQHPRLQKVSTTRPSRLRLPSLPKPQSTPLDEEVPLHMICDEMRWDSAYLDQLVRNLSI